MKKKLMFIASHLSTGGMPQYLFKQIELLQNNFDIYCIEWSDITGGKLVVQRNKIKNLLQNKLITLKENKEELFNHIKLIKPDFIHLQECPEYFIDYEIASKLYSPERKYVIIETSHDSSFDIKNKKHFPDKFMMVSQYQINNFQPLGIPCELVEYPIEYKEKTKSREELLQSLGLDPNLKHIINIGLFTPRKNQAEIIEYAKKLNGYPIQFHFIGNQADNFQWYWEPIMKDFPSNCKWWNERTDVDTFYEMADLFLFTSRGTETDKETMPLVIREAIGWKTPSLIYNLPVYLDYFNKFNNISYLDFDSLDTNCSKILAKLNLEKNKVDDYFNIGFIKEENKITLDYKKQETLKLKITVKEKDSNAPLYWFKGTFENYCNWWVVPCPLDFINIGQNPNFGTILLEFYDENNNLLFFKDIFVKEVPKKKIRLDLKNSFDCLFGNYNEMFIENEYDCYGLDNLDTVLDIGANSGLFSLLLLEKGCKNVYAFEPNQDALTNLKHILKNRDNLKIVEKAVYSEDKDLEFFIDIDNTTIGSFMEEHLGSGDNIKKITVPAISLKTFVKENNIKNISLVKMDIEGAEYNIIENLEDEIYNIIDSFLIEWHDNSDKRINSLINKLKNKGYNIEQIRNQNSGEELTYGYENSKVGTFLAKKPKNNLLTVVIPTYNHEKYVEECINSVLKQKTLFNYNILISDDCSTDNTFNLVQKYKDIPNIIIHQTEKNEGGTPLRIYNIIKNIKSDYVTFLDGDDYYLDEFKLQKQINFLENNSEYVIHSTGHYVDKEDSIAYGTNPPTELYMHSVKEEVFLKDNLEKNYISFGFMFENIIKDIKFPNWFFEEDVFDGYWALINILLQYGKAKNEKWIGGRYRITPNGEFGWKDEEWKQEQIKKQSEVLKNVEKSTIKPILIVDAFFHDKHCLGVFKKYLSFIKELNIPIMLVTNSEFDPSLIKEVDYILYDSNDRLFEQKYNDIDNIVFWYKNAYYYISLGTKGFQKHGLSVLSNIYHSTNLAKSLGYTHFYRIEYDCEIEKLNKVKEIIDNVYDSRKKGFVYINENKFVSFQIWYFELEYFTKYFPEINNEEDYIEKKKAFNYNKDFISAEEFIYNMIKISDGGFDNIIVKDAPLMHTDFGSCLWNTVMTPLESDKIVDGFISSLHKVTKHINHDLSPENSPLDTSKAALITWNCSSSNANKSQIKIKYPSGEIKLLDHSIEGNNDHRIDIIELEDQDIEIEIVINDHKFKNLKVNKNNIHLFNDTYQEYN